MGEKSNCRLLTSKYKADRMGCKADAAHRLWLVLIGFDNMAVKIDFSPI